MVLIFCKLLAKFVLSVVMNWWDGNLLLVIGNSGLGIGNYGFGKGKRNKLIFNQLLNLFYSKKNYTNFYVLCDLCVYY
jgi:hypothetical protein